MNAMLLVLLVVLIEVSVGVAMIIGALKMMRLQSYGWAMTASILALLPCSPANLLGLAIGIWSLVVLNRPPVRAAFQAAAGKSPVESSGSRRQRSSAAWIVVAIVGLGVLLLPCVLAVVWRGFMTSSNHGPSDWTTTRFAQWNPADENSYWSEASQSVVGGSGGLAFGPNGPSVSDDLARQLKLQPYQRDVIDQTLQSFYPQYKELEERKTLYATDEKGHQRTTIRQFDDPPPGNLEGRFWSAVDPVLNDEQRRLARQHLPLRSGAFQCGGLSVEIWREGAWFHWQVSNSSLEAGHRVDTAPYSDSGPRLPPNFRRFWKEPTSDDANIQGAWSCLSALVDGQAIAEHELPRWKHTFENGQYTLLGDVIEKGTYKLDPAKMPKRIDVVILEGSDAGHLVAGIYELDGDTLKICWAPLGELKHPQDFSSAPGSSRTSIILKRETPGDAVGKKIATPATPVAQPDLVRLERVGHLPAGVNDPFLSLAVEGQHAYLIQGNAETPKRLHVVDLTDPSQPRIVGSTPVTTYAMRLAMSGHFIYVLDEPNFRVFDVSNPAEPHDVGSCELGKGLWDLAIQGRYAYVTDVESVRVIDLENPAAPKQVGRCEVETAQGIAVAGQYAHVACDIEGLHILDISDPQSPQEVGVFRSPQGAADVAVVDKYAYIAGGEDAVTLWIADVSHPKRPKGVGKFGDWIQGSIAVQGDYAFLAGGDLDIVDISNPAAPQRAGSYPGATDLVAVDDRLYIVNDDGFSILRVVNTGAAADPPRTP